MADMGTKEAAEKWGYSQATVRSRCQKGLIQNATQDSRGSPRHIPHDAKCPKKLKSKASIKFKE